MKMGAKADRENCPGKTTLAKTTLNVPYWLTTEMRECGGWEFSITARDGVTGLLY